jgi:hypothetical protein
MAEASTFSDRLKVGLEAQVKFEFYFVGLIFTLLGLSVQSAKFEINFIASSCELLGWLTLLGSGLIALFRLKRIPDKHLALAELGMLESRNEALKGLEEQWQPRRNIMTTYPDTRPPLATILEEMTKTVTAMGTLRDDVNNIERGIRWRAVLQTWLFIVGICLVVTARAIGPAMDIWFSLPIG